MKSLDGSVVEANVTGDASARASDQVLAVLRRFWGFEGLRPLQLEAIQAGLDRRD
jgi:superfamily II DNA helicase RecQ